MKKFLAILMTFALLCCSAVAETVDITGMWYYDIYGLIATMELRADNTVTIDFVGDIQDGTYTFDGANLVLSLGDSGEDNMGIYDPETQTISVDEGTFIFGRDEIIPFEPAPARAEAAIQDFTGTWETIKVGTQGLYIDPAGAGVSLDAIIVGESVNLTMYYGEEGFEMPLVGVLADGVLTAGITTDDGSGNTSSVSFDIRVLEDGTLSALFIEGGDITFYLVPVVEEAAEEIPAE